MKYLRYLATIVALGCLVNTAKAVSSGVNPISVILNATFQAATTGPVTKTNITATTTNLVATSKFTATNQIINNATLVKMLANSFNTNFPANAELKLSNSGDFVIAVGTNVIRNVSGVLHSTFSSNPRVTKGVQTESAKFTPTAVTLAEQVAFNQTSNETLTYDDSALTTANGQTTKFTASGTMVLRYNQAVKSVNSVNSSALVIAITQTCAGSGIINGKNAVIQSGRMTGSVSAITP